MARKEIPNLYISGKYAYVRLPDRKTGHHRVTYCGPANTVKALDRYHEIIKRWQANGCQLEQSVKTPRHVDGIISDILAGYLMFLADEPICDGERQTQITLIKRLNEWIGNVTLSELSPNHLQTVQKNMVDLGRCRRPINREMSRVRKIFKWACRQGLIPADKLMELNTLEPLRLGKYGVTDKPRVKPANLQDVATIRARLRPDLQRLIDLLILTGARSGELCSLRFEDIDKSRPVWIADLEKHKTSHKGLERRLYFGPKAQQIINDMGRTEGFLFAGRLPGTHLLQKSFGRALRRAFKICNQRITKQAKKNGIEPVLIKPWSPHQLRHLAATQIRSGFGIEAAQHAMGHSTIKMTELYAEKDQSEMMNVFASFG